MNVSKPSDLKHATCQAVREGRLLTKEQQKKPGSFQIIYGNTGDEGNNINILLWALPLGGLTCILFLPEVTVMCWLIVLVAPITHIAMRKADK